MFIPTVIVTTNLLFPLPTSPLYFSSIPMLLLLGMLETNKIIVVRPCWRRCQFLSQQWLTQLIYVSLPPPPPFDSALWILNDCTNLHTHKLYLLISIDQQQVNVRLTHIV